MSHRQRYRIKGLMCDGCVKTLRAALSQTPHLTEIVVSEDRKWVEMTITDETTFNCEIISLIEDAGYTVSKAAA